MKKILALLLVVILTATVSISGTLAFVQAQAADEDTIAEGEVRIDQHIYYRDIQTTSNSQTCTLNERTSTQKIYLYPAVYSGNEPASDAYQATEIGTQSFYSAPNVQDEIVVVENNGKSNAYVRTWFAIECGSMSEAQFESFVTLKSSSGTDWTWSNDANIIQIDGVNFYITYATYSTILAPNETTSPSLLQIMLNKETGNTECAALDGSGNNMLDIHIISQAGWMENSNATQTLSAMFPGDPWTGSSSTQSAVTYVGTAEQLREALKVGGEIVLCSDIIINSPDDVVNPPAFWIKKDTVLDMNGYTVAYTADEPLKDYPGIFYAYGGAKFTLQGNGNINVPNSNAFAIWATDADIIVNGSISFTSGKDSQEVKDLYALVYASSADGSINIYGGSFTFDNLKSGTNGGFNVYDSGIENLVITIHEGVLLSNKEYRQPDTATSQESKRIQLAQDCELQEVEIDGRTWWKVVKTTAP